jgi:hypothetical protein
MKESTNYLKDRNVRHHILSQITYSLPIQAEIQDYQKNPSLLQAPPTYDVSALLSLTTYSSNRIWCGILRVQPVVVVILLIQALLSLR